MTRLLRTSLFLLFGGFIALLPHGAQAQERLMAKYIADIGPQDHFNSSGALLTTFAALLAQDRANYHRFGIRHPNDGSDPIFGSRAMRAQINGATVQIPSYYTPYTSHMVNNRPGASYMVVYVFGNGATISRITIEVPG